MIECKSEQAAATVLGYGQVSWDNLSGEELQPWQAKMPWVSLNSVEKQAAVILGYTQLTWDDKETEAQPDSFHKTWFKLTECGKSEIA